MTPGSASARTEKQKVRGRAAVAAFKDGKESASAEAVRNDDNCDMEEELLNGIG